MGILDERQKLPSRNWRNEGGIKDEANLQANPMKCQWKINWKIYLVCVRRCLFIRDHIKYIFTYSAISLWHSKWPDRKFKNKYTIYTIFVSPTLGNIKKIFNFRNFLNAVAFWMRNESNNKCASPLIWMENETTYRS